MTGVYMTIPLYFEEISDYIESNITQADIILKNLYDKHLKKKDTHATPSFTKNKSDIFYSLPSSTHKKIKIEPSLSSTLTKILNLYDVEPANILAILNAFVSYFPEEIHKLPEHIKSQLNIVKPSDILSHAVDESLMFQMVVEGKTDNLDPLLGELPDKGKNIINRILQDGVSYYPNLTSSNIKFLGQIPASIAALPLSLKNHIFNILLKFFTHTERDTALAALAHSLSTIPNFQQNVSKKLYDILQSNEYFYHREAAQCLNQLVDKGLLHYSDESKEIIVDYLNHLKNASHIYEKLHIIISLSKLENLLSLCDTDITKEMLLTLCHILNTEDFLAGNVLVTLSNLSHVIANMPKELIDCVINDFIKQVPHLPNTDIREIKKLQCVLEKNPIYIEKMLSAIFNEIMSSSGPDNNKFKITQLGELFVSWHGLLKDMKHIEIAFLKKLYQHFKENEPSKWIKDCDFATLIRCFEHLPEETSLFVDFFKERLNDNDMYTRNYAMYALGHLHFSLSTQPDSGLSVLAHMNEDLSKDIQDNKCTPHTYNIFSSFGLMSNLLNIHQEFIKDVFMNLTLCVSTLQEKDNTKSTLMDKKGIVKSINLLQKHLNHVSVAPEDKKKILTFLEKNVSTSLETLYLLSKHMNKYTLCTQYLAHFIDDPEFPQLLINITSDIPTNSQRLSFACMLANFLKHYHPQASNANAVGALFFHLKRQELLSEQLPKELVTCVEEYIDEGLSFKTKSY